MSFGDIRADEDILTEAARIFGEGDVPTRRPELIFAVVRTLGTEIEPVLLELEERLRACQYSTVRVKLSNLLSAGDRAPETEAQRYEMLMNAGDAARSVLGRSDAVVLKGIERMIQLRGEVPPPRAFLVHTLVHHEEINTLRNVYGSRLFVVACDQVRSRRLEVLTHRFSADSALSRDEAEAAALHAVNRDAGVAQALDEVAREISPRYRVHVGKTLERADVFVSGDKPEAARRIVRRLVECVMSHPFHTPTLDELGMAAAFHAALGTSTLSRRVGASVMREGQIVAIGMNEVPKSGGGVYHAESDPDGREWRTQGSASDRARAKMLGDILRRLRDSGWLREDLSRDASIGDLIQRATDDGRLAGSEIFDVIEYDRATHAEMVAITGAARLGISVDGATLYTTTLPCHECTRNIIPSGISRVVYLEPYDKSRGAEFHFDSMSLINRSGKQFDKLAFEPYSGFSYQRFYELFAWVDRKMDDVRKANKQALTFTGEPVAWTPNGASVRPSIFSQQFGAVELVGQLLRERLLLMAIAGPPAIGYAGD
ncbi:deaminase [Couchioplanes caeruleus]|uniref:deaminase n=1 Tax=Couchioplanes caeruleus TaxID=56438 RepID=UPI00201C7C62|nr:deaminase [Couchioplanes caeruleus]UQU68231.1 deaminase [Couchioplanes caeruleus]